MAEETLTPVSAAEPPKANPLSKPVSAMSGIKLPPKPMIKKPVVGAAAAPAAAPKPAPATTSTTAATVIKPAVKLPPKPMIRKPGMPGAAAPSLPKPLPKPVVAGGTTPAPAPAAPQAAPAPAEKPAHVTSSLEQLKHVTQRLKSVTQPIPQQAILHKTGIISESGLSDLTPEQKNAAKSKTARISLSEAMGAAPVKNDAAPTKTIRIKRPGGLPLGGPASVVKSAAPQPGQASAPAAAAATSSTTMTQKKTLKVARPVGAVRPGAPKPAIKKPTTVTSAATIKKPVAPQAGGDIPDIADIPDIPDIPAKGAAPQAQAEADVPKMVGLASLIVQIAACGVAAMLVKALYNSWILPMVFGGCAA